MQQSLQVKQQYLRDSILAQNYDAEQFIAFACKQCEVDSIDIEQLSLNTLKQIVYKFKQYKQYTARQVSGMIVHDDLIKQVKQKHSKVVYVQRLIWDKEDTFDYEFSKVCKCIQVDSLLKEDNLIVSVPDFEVVESEGIIFNIGAKTEIWFTIVSNIVKGKTKRLAEDFEWLSTTISRIFPIFAIPELVAASKEPIKSNERRRQQIEQYLQILASRNQLKWSHLFLDFLTVNQDKMNKLKKTYDSMGFVKGVSALKNLQGEIQVALCNKQRNFHISSNEYLRKVSRIHQTLHESIEKVIESLNVASNEINKVVDSYADLHETYKELCNKYPENECNSYSDMLININNLFHSLSDNLRSNSQLVADHLKTYHKLTINNDRAIIRLQKHIYDIEHDYTYLKVQLARKKQRIYPDPNKWQVDPLQIDSNKMPKEKAFEIMLPKETVYEDEQRLWLAFLYNHFSRMFKKYIIFSTRRYAVRLEIFCAELSIRNSVWVSGIKNFIDECSKIKQCEQC